MSAQPEGSTGEFEFIRKAGGATFSWDYSQPPQDVVTVSKAFQWDFWKDTPGGMNEGEGEGVWKGEGPRIL